MTAPPSAAPSRAALMFIALAIVLDATSQSIVFPILPRLAQDLVGGNPSVTAAWVGYLEVAWALPQFFAAPVLGLLSDRFGRRPVIVASMFGMAGEHVLCALAPDIAWLMAGRILCGFTCAAQAAALAYIADITPPDQRAGRYGWVTASAWCGVLVGPALGGLLAGVDLRAPFWAAAGVSAVAGLYGLFVLPESHPRSARIASLRFAANPWAASFGILLRPNLLPLSLALLLVWLAFQANDNMLVLYTAYRYGWTPLAFGLFATALAAVSIVVQTRVTGPVTRRLGERPVVTGGLGLQAIGLAICGLAPTTEMFWLGYIPIVAGSLAQPALQALMSRRVGEDEQGRLQGASSAVLSLTSLTAPIAVTQGFAWAVAQGQGPLRYGVMVLAAAVLTLAASAIVMSSRRPAHP